ncbi:MAG: cytochrome P450 [Gemmatimonadaceae bacterium]|nr:cytochrome P450 [Gemmatimonadaceae bacterium]
MKIRLSRPAGKTSAVRHMIGKPNAMVNSAASLPPTTTLLDLMRLAGGIAGEVIRHPRTFSVRTVFRKWARHAAARRGSANLVLNFGVKRILLVGGSELSKAILDARPSPGGITMGEAKRKGMSFLAPHALTISDGAEWERLRAFNEGVLEPGRPHEHERVFLGHVLAAFETPIRDINGIRAAMSRSMLGIVFGGKAPAWLADDVQTLVGLVQNPVKRRIMGFSGRRRRERFYAALRDLWRDPAAVRTASLLGVAHRSATARPAGDETLLLEQLPHWMFTFTGSGTDLVARALTLILSDADVRRRVETELEGTGALEEPATIRDLALVEACLIEGAHLFPPVTKTFHCAPAGASVAGVVIPPGMEVLHSFPLVAESDATEVRRFRPERWLESGRVTSGFDPFLGGARGCPGRSIILHVSKAALAVMIGRQRLTLDGVTLKTDDLPLEFPRRGVAFRPA